MKIRDYNEAILCENITLSGEECMFPGTNLLMKIRLGKEPIEDYNKRRDACLEAIRRGAVIFKIEDHKDMYFVDLYRDGKLVKTINGRAFNQGNASDIRRTFKAFKYDKKTGKFYLKAEMEFRSYYLNGGGSYTSSSTHWFEGDVKKILRFVREEKEYA